MHEVNKNLCMVCSFNFDVSVWKFMCEVNPSVSFSLPPSPSSSTLWREKLLRRARVADLGFIVLYIWGWKKVATWRPEIISGREMKTRLRTQEDQWEGLDAWAAHSNYLGLLWITHSPWWLKGIEGEISVAVHPLVWATKDIKGTWNEDDPITIECM